MQRVFVILDVLTAETSMYKLIDRVAYIKTPYSTGPVDAGVTPDLFFSCLINATVTQGNIELALILEICSPCYTPQIRPRSKNFFGKSTVFERMYSIASVYC